MSQPARPAIFRSVWPPEPHVDAPTDTRLARLPARGPVHLLLLISMTILVLSLLPSLVVAGAASSAATWPLPSWPAIVGALLGAAALALLLRAWGRGTYVNHHGYLVRRLLRSERGRWSELSTVDEQHNRLVLVRATGASIRTHVGRRTIDTVFRPEAADMAMLRLIALKEQSQ